MLVPTNVVNVPAGDTYAALTALLIILVIGDWGTKSDLP